MKNIKTPLIKSLLNTIGHYNIRTIKEERMFAEEYIYISDIIYREGMIKDGFGYKGSVNISYYSPWYSKSYSYSKINDVITDLLENLKPNKQFVLDLKPDFNMFQWQLINSNEFEKEWKDKRRYIVVLQFWYEICEIESPSVYRYTNLTNECGGRPINDLFGIHEIISIGDIIYIDEELLKIADGYTFSDGHYLYITGKLGQIISKEICKK